MSVYAGLADALAAQEWDIWKVGFGELERLIGRALPASAYKYPAWWSNDPSNNSMTKVWLRAGWRTEQVDVPGRTVVFRRVSPPEAAGVSVLADRRRAFEPAAGRATGLEYKAFGFGGRAPAYEAKAAGGGGVSGAPHNSEGAARVDSFESPDGESGDEFVSVEEFVAALPADHPFAALFGFLKGMVSFAPGFDPCESACAPEEWAEAAVEAQAGWDEHYGAGADRAKRATEGADAS
ncbi:MAG: hypothetical protein Kow00133_00920 [Amphiplicatus sp.]